MVCPITQGDHNKQLNPTLLCRPPFTDEGQIWCARADPRSTLTRQISSECVHCVGFRWPKPQFWANFDIFGGSCTDSLLPMRAIFDVLYQTHRIRLPVKFRLDRLILSSCGGEKSPNFAVFAVVWTLAFSDVANWQKSQKVEHGCTPTPAWRNQAHKICRSKA